MKQKTVVITTAVLIVIAALWAYKWERRDIANLEEIRYQVAQLGEVLQEVNQRTADARRPLRKILKADAQNRLIESLEGIRRPIKKGQATPLSEESDLSDFKYNCYEIAVAQYLTEHPGTAIPKPTSTALISHYAKSYMGDGKTTCLAEYNTLLAMYGYPVDADMVKDINKWFKDNGEPAKKGGK